MRLPATCQWRAPQLGVPPLGYLVGVVVQARANAQVCRVDARRVVARVHDHFVSVEMAADKLLDDPAMRPDAPLAGRCRFLEPAVAINIPARFPFPTCVNGSNSDFLPKSVGYAHVLRHASS